MDIISEILSSELKYSFLEVGGRPITPKRPGSLEDSQDPDPRLHEQETVLRGPGCSGSWAMLGDPGMWVSCVGCASSHTCAWD